jgi:hypothetical protein
MNRAIALHRLRPVTDRTFPFAEAKAAYRHFEGRGHFGDQGGRPVLQLGERCVEMRLIMIEHAANIGLPAPSRSADPRCMRRAGAAPRRCRDEGEGPPRGKSGRSEMAFANAASASPIR